MPTQIALQESVPEELDGARLDQAAAQLFPTYSRSRLQTWIKSGELTVDGAPRKARDPVVPGEQLQLRAELEESDRWEPFPIDLDVVFEDEQLLVINKPAGLVVHPAAGNPTGTLLNALLARHPELAAIPRAGIVHRLDKDTTGLMVVAKTLEAQHHLVDQLQAREVSREYLAVVFGTMTGGGCVDAPIARHPQHRQKMAVTDREDEGKEAITHYRLEARFANHTLVRCMLETGRTHQIRVHMAHIRHPLVGDPLYAGRPRLPKAASQLLIDTLRGFRRQALHATRLALTHPLSGDELVWERPPPEDLTRLIAVLRSDDAP